jgi:phosphoenolpyruvate synthase/pyruvate phosphate dikinase
MAAHVVIPLVEFSRYSEAVIGTRGVKLGKYDTLALPLPITVAIPQSAFSQLIDESGLISQLSEVKKISWSDPAARQKAKEFLRSSIQKQKFPEWFSSPVLEIYHSEFQRGFVRLLPGEQVTQLDTTRFEHIQGDANFFESLLEFWSSWVEHQVDLQRTINRITLIPSSVIIQEQTQASASGVAYTQHPTHGIKTQVYIQAIKGCPYPELLDSQADDFAVDLRSWNVVFKNVQTQTRMMQRASDHVESLPLPYSEQLSPALTDGECMKLAQYIQQLKLHAFEHQKVSWELTAKGFMLTDIAPLEDPRLSPTAARKTKTFTKVYVSAGNPHKANVVTSALPDGIGVLRSEYTYAQFGIHPAHIIHSRQREVLERQLAQVITAYQASVSYQRVIFRSQNLHSQENILLEYGHSHEPIEDNPYLGFRGGLKLATHPELLRIETNAILAALSRQAGQIGYMLSFVRTPEELSTLIHHVEMTGLTQRPQFELWWQINTPENILNIKAYPLHKLTGISVNIKTLQALMHGIDPDNPEVFERYQLDTTVLSNLMELVAHAKEDVTALRRSGNPLLIHVHLEDFSRELVASAVKLRYDGVVVKPRALEMARVVVLEEEETVLRR